MGVNGGTLVLSRKIDEAIILVTPDGYRIRILVADFRDGDKVRLGIQAAPEVSINREEVQIAVDREARAAEELLKARARGVDRGEYPPGESRPVRPKPEGGPR